MNASFAPPNNPPRGRLAVVSGLAHNPMSPRGQRTQHLMGELGKRWELELVALPAETFADDAAPLSSRPLHRRALGVAMRSVALDRWEPWASRRLRGWHPDVDAGLLVGYPWSPLTRAGRVLAQRGIPYVIDAGDPWVVTEPGELPRTVSVWRARRAELPLWRNAAGAVLTTRQQADRVREAFPHLRVLVRPNGFVPSAAPGAAAPAAPRRPGSLRLAHFGKISPIRVDVVPLLAALRATGLWRTIEFVQFGDDYAGMLSRAPQGIEIKRRPARPWEEIVADAGEFDAAVVLGNQRGDLLPSKAVQYLTLPIPRIAVTNGEPGDALAAYAGAHRGWLIAAEGDCDAGERVRRHVERDWPAEDLAPPAEESWASVAVEVAAFIEDCVGGGQPAPAPDPMPLGGRGG